MAPPRIPDSVIKTIEIIWAENPSQTATEVFAKFRRYHDDKISLRTVQGIVKKAKERNGRESFTPDEWRPWQNEHESCDDTTYLLVLDAIKMACLARHLYRHEARWARRIRSALDGLTPWEQSVFVDEYARREEIGHVLKLDQVYTADLDGLLAFQPWKTANEDGYSAAVSAAIVPAPIGYGPQAVMESVQFMEKFKQAKMFSPPFPFKGKWTDWMLAQLMFIRAPKPISRILDLTPFSGLLMDPVPDSWGVWNISGQGEEHSVAPEGENHEG